MSKEIFKFKKGEIKHLDDFFNIQAWVMIEGFSEPYNRGNLIDWTPEMTDEHKILKNFTITVEIK